MRKKIIVVTLLIIMTIGFIIYLQPIEQRKYGLSKSALSTDYTGLLPTKIERIEQANSVEQLQKIVQQANENGQKISIAGRQHSQGGHTYYKDGIVIDMKTFNKVLEINEENKTVRVEAGATFDDVQQEIAPHGLALKVTQSQSIFTIGGSLSINAHGRDIRFGSMASTVEALTWLTPTGEIEYLTKAHDAEQLAYILGGYGLFGIIVDVTLALTDNESYEIETESLNVATYESYFTNILANEDIAMHYARLSVAPKTFLEDVYAINYYKTGEIISDEKLKGEQGVKVSKFALDLGRRGGAAEDFFWATQKRYIHSLHGDMISRNNLMRSESTFMEFTGTGRVEVLQEYFVSVHQFEEYVEALKQFLPHDDSEEAVKLHNITLRYVAKDEETKLNFATEDMLGFVLLLQHGTSEQEISAASEFIQQWTDITLAHGGTYYLPYYPYQSAAQFTQAYPNAVEFAEMKAMLDPNEVFVNLFYDNYIKDVQYD